MEKQIIKSKFRLATKSLFLTYSNVNITEYFSEDDILQQLKKILIKRNINITVFNISQEISSRNKHFHVFLLLDKKLDTTNKRIFDLKRGKVFFHGNYQSANSKKNLVKEKNVVKQQNKKIVLNNKKKITLTGTMLVTLKYCLKEIRFTWTNISWKSLKEIYSTNSDDFYSQLLQNTLQLY